MSKHFKVAQAITVLSVIMLQSLKGCCHIYI